VKQVFFVPGRGDVIMISPAASDGKSGTGRRPALVLSPQAYNARVGLALVCPITPLITGYPFEVALPAGLPVAGVILADQASDLDWRAHRAEHVCATPSPVVEEVLGKLRALLT
jgi:mRNA interferase MazF